MGKEQNSEANIGKLREAELVLVPGGNDNGIAQLADDPKRATFAAACDALETRFAGRVLPVSDDVVRRGGDRGGQPDRPSGRTNMTVIWKISSRCRMKL